jgi:hypothetical protein
MSPSDHDDPRLRTEDIANATDRRTDNELADDRLADDRVDGDRVDGDRVDGDEAQTRLDEAPTEQLPTQDSDDSDEVVAEQPRTMPTDEEPAELFPHQDVEQFRTEWQQIQARFVDDPRDAVQSADHLVAAVMQSLATTFTNHKHELEDQWQQGSDVETEDLRLALRRYRSFFNQLLNV